LTPPAKRKISAPDEKGAFLPPSSRGKEKIKAIVGQDAVSDLQAVVAAMSNRANGPKAFVDTAKTRWSLAGAETFFTKTSRQGKPSTELNENLFFVQFPPFSWRIHLQLAAKR
jgi:hypothetical protein